MAYLIPKTVPTYVVLHVFCDAVGDRHIFSTLPGHHQQSVDVLQVLRQPIIAVFWEP